MAQIKKIAVISDIHANADALSRVLGELEDQNIDLFIILGDLLTYGCQPNEVLSILSSLNKHKNCIFIKGNHDQIYFDRQSGSNKNGYTLRGFVKESVEWTESKLAGVNLLDLFDWKEHHSVAPIYFSHANPCEYGDWRYLEGFEQYKVAADILREKKYKIGIFGHTHRKYAMDCDDRNFTQLFLGNTFNFYGESILLINAGSIGQPRGTGFGFMVLDLMENSINWKLIEFEIEITNSINLIKQSGMSTETIERLVSYLRN